MGDDPTISQFEAVIPAVALDISRQGLRLRTTYAVELNSLLSAIVYFRGQGSVCLCKVMWKRDEMGEHLYGLFIEEWPQIDPSLERQLKAMEIKDNSSMPSSSGGPAVVATALA